MIKASESNFERHGEDTLCRKLTRTVFLVSVWICLGLVLEIHGPTFKDIQIQTSASTETTARAMSGKSVGYFIGAIIGGLLVDKFTQYWYLFIALGLDIMAIAAFITPWSPYIEVLWVLFTLQGACSALINIAGQKLILSIWKSKASSPLHVIHCGYGIGAFIVPVIANPFLAVPAPANQFAGNVSDLTATSVSTLEMIGYNNSYLNNDFNHSLAQRKMTAVRYLKESSIVSAYNIVGGIAGLLSIVFFVFQFRNFKRFGNSAINSDTKIPSLQAGKRTTFREILDPATCGSGNRIYSIKILTLLFLFYLNAVGVESLIGKFIRNYSIDQLNFSVDEGSSINTSFWISFSIGRFSGFIAAKWIPIKILLLIEVFGVLITTVLINIFARHSGTMLWVLLQPLGLFQAPMYPSAMAWANKNLVVTGSVLTWIIFGASTGAVAYMFIIGYFYDNHGSLSFLYLLAAFGVIITFITILLIIAGKTRGHKDTSEDEIEMNVPENRVEKK